ncbi:tail fiber component of prophage CP-933T [Escherichia coli]|nr:tail fiber component of prophage CP-933T [Escherichia coli]
MEDLLADLYKATRKYGEVDRVSFFKDIAGEEAFTSFMALVDAAGDGSLPKLRKELEGARGEAERTAKVMANNLDGDLKSLGSAWEGVRIRIADLIDGPQRSVTQWLTRVVSKVTALAQAHPALTRQLLVAGGALLAMTATIGSLSLAIGVLAGPLAKLRLGFSLLTGSLNVVRVLPALWGMVTGSISLLGGAIGALFSPVGLIAAAFVAAAVLIWKYWEPIKAFYAGCSVGLWNGWLRCAKPLNGLALFLTQSEAGSARCLTGLNRCCHRWSPVRKRWINVPVLARYSVTFLAVRYSLF